MSKTEVIINIGNGKTKVDVSIDNEKFCATEAFICLVLYFLFFSGIGLFVYWNWSEL